MNNHKLSRTSVRSAGALAPLLVFVACSAPNDPRTSSKRAPLVGGALATEADFPSTVFIGCSAAKVGPRHFLTAAHCLIDSKCNLNADKVPGAVQRVTTDNVLDGQEQYSVFHVVHTDVSPDYVKACLSGNGGVIPAPHVPDIGLVTVDVDSPNIPTASIDETPVALGDRVVVGGYGCENGVGQPSPGPERYKIKTVSTGGAQIWNH